MQETSYIFIEKNEVVDMITIQETPHILTEKKEVKNHIKNKKHMIKLLCFLTQIVVEFCFLNILTDLF